ncbi:hypothetical protein QBC43DRAFT_319137 [Cladorrhinum sp. PSN259]|nr:hypothetical protein QBC43DRAFT_319137 [Cladorrhinum sp. PSN259]
MALQAQWALDSTSSSVISFSRDLIRVATSDNVQPLALLACQNFGSTIAMCRETCDRIQTDVLPTPPKALINFVKTSVGFSRHDCATQLGSSAAGLNFLGLAAALVTTMGALESARALTVMLKATVADPTTPLPTTQQLKELLLSLEPRLTRSLFTETVVGWGFLLNQVTYNRRDSCHPSPQAVEKLVDAFRRLSRIGEASIKKVEIQVVPKCIPWVTGFTKWCLGVPPNVFGDNGTPVISQPGSNVDIIPSTFEEFTVTILHDLPFGPEDLIIIDDKPKPWSGMVTVEKYGEHFREHCGIQSSNDTMDVNSGDDIPFRALVQCASITAGRVLKEVLFVYQKPGNERTERVLSDINRRFEQPEEIKELFTSPFSDRSGHSVARILTRLLYAHPPAMSVNIHDDTETRKRHVTELLDVNAYLQILKRACQCDECGTASPRSRRCLTAKFLRTVSTLVADTLAIALFDSLGSESDLLVRVNNWSPVKQGNCFLETVSSILDQHPVQTLQRPPQKVCDIQSLLDWALALAGHDVQVAPLENTEGYWAMSCFRGHAIFPTIYENPRISKTGYLSLSLIHGVLEYEGHRYHVVRGRDQWEPTASSFDHNSNPSLHEGVDRPLSLYPQLELRGFSWTVETGDRIMTLSVCLNLPILALPTFDPFVALGALSRSLVVDSCTHHPATPLHSSNRDMAYVTPISSGKEGRRISLVLSATEISVVASDSNDHLRFYYLSGFDRSTLDFEFFPLTVVRLDACLRCCLDVCRKFECKILVL